MSSSSHSTQSPDSPPRPSPNRSKSRARRLIGFAIAIALFAAAVFAVWTNAADAPSAVRSGILASPWLAAAAVLLPAANWLIMSLSLWSLINRFGRVPLGEMICLIGAGWLLNYLPLRPGLFGRVAYHKKVHNIAIRDSIRVSIWSIACAGGAIGVLAPLCLVAARFADTASHVLLIAAGPILVLTAVTLILSRPWPRLIALNLLLRYLDLLTWSCRYAVVFALIDRPISWPVAGALACIVQVPMLIPVVGNGLGLREWTVGAMAGVLPAGELAARGSLSTSTGLAADLVNRVAEVCCAVPVGLACAVFLYLRKLRLAKHLR